MSLSSATASKSSTAIVSSNSPNRDPTFRFFEAQTVANDRRYAELFLTLNNFYEKMSVLCNDEDRLASILERCKQKAARQINRVGFGYTASNNVPMDFDDIPEPASRSEPAVQNATNTSNAAEKKRRRADQEDVVGAYQAHRQIMSKEKPPASYHETDCARSDHQNELVDVQTKGGKPRKQKRVPDLTKDNGTLFTSHGLTTHWKSLSDDEKAVFASKGKDLTAKKKAKKEEQSSAAAAEPVEVPSKSKRKAPVEEESESDNESSNTTNASKPVSGPPIQRASSNKSSGPSTSTDLLPPARGDSAISARALFGENDEDEEDEEQQGDETAEQLED
jgi:hypothetical protein